MLTGSRAMSLGVAVVVVLTAGCSHAGTVGFGHHKFMVVGSTACDAAIKSQLSIPAETKCDFIRWKLTLDEARGKAFTLHTTYGEGQPNTLGFIGGGQKIAAGGKFDVSVTGARSVYRLTSDRPAIRVSLLKLNDNLFHLLTAEGAMMIGNGGWSYTLNRHPAAANGSLPAFAVTPADRTKQAEVIFDGRTPCKELVGMVEIPSDIGECFKIKWRIRLNRDAATLGPTTFTIESTISRRQAMAGTWTETRSGDAVIYRLAPDAPGKPISFLLAEDNLLFLLDAQGRPMTGNEDFSFTLNRK